MKKILLGLFLYCSVQSFGQAKLNTALKNQLDIIMSLDQQYRGNMQGLTEVIKKFGYPGTSLVGPGTDEAAWHVIQHSNRIRSLCR